MFRHVVDVADFRPTEDHVDILMGEAAERLPLCPCGVEVRALRRGTCEVR